MDFASLEPLDGGWSGETFLARVGDGERQVVRIHARRPARAEVDAALMRLVRGLLPVPEVLDVRRASGEMPALLITSLLPGERGDVVLPRLGPSEQATLGAGVGELAAALAGMPQPRPGEYADGDLAIRPWSGGAAGLEAFAQQALAQGLHHWTAEERDGLLRVADLAEELLATVDRVCLVHSDLNPKNLLVDPASLAITGLVDWEYAHAGHPFTDLGNVLRFDRQPDYVEAVLATYGRVRGVEPSEALSLARAADLFALIELAGRAGTNPVAERAEDRLQSIARTGDLHAVTGDARLLG